MDNGVLTFIIAAGGWLVALGQVIFGHLERQQKRNDELLLKTAEYFKGSAQERNIGISLIEGLIKSRKHQYGVIIPLLANQFIYLLIQTSETSADEERNLVRIFILLNELIHTDQIKYHYEKCEVLDAIGRRIDEDYPEKSAIDISDVTLKMWKQKLEN